MATDHPDHPVNDPQVWWPPRPPRARSPHEDSPLLRTSPSVSPADVPQTAVNSVKLAIEGIPTTHIPVPPPRTLAMPAQAARIPAQAGEPNPPAAGRGATPEAQATQIMAPGPVTPVMGIQVLNDVTSEDEAIRIPDQGVTPGGASPQTTVTYHDLTSAHEVSVTDTAQPQTSPADAPAADPAAARSAAPETETDRQEMGIGPADQTNEAAIDNLRRALAISQQRVAALVSHSPVGAAVVGTDGVITHVNPLWSHIVGLENIDLTTNPSLHDLIHPEDRELASAEFGDVWHGHRAAHTRELRLVRPSGETVWVRLSLATICDEDQVSHLIAQVYDITETRLAASMVAHQAVHDPLTGLTNRAGCVHTAQRALERAQRTHTSVAALCVNVDHFHVLTDSLGPRGADAVLVAIGRRLQVASQRQACVARMGADEFIVLCESVTDTAAVTELADRILEAVRAALDIDGHLIHPQVSIGIATSHPTDNDALRLLRDAGIALHHAQLQRRGTWHLLEEGQRQLAVDRVGMESQLRHAIDEGELRLHLQPIVDLTSGTVVGREALVRWQHPHRGLLAPIHFLPMAEETGLIDQLGRWVLTKAAEVAAAGPHLGYIAVNISPSQMRRSELVADVAQVLDETNLDPSALVLELTESTALGSTRAAQQQLHDLDDLGVRIVVDDFGTGFSPLSHLRDLPISGIKIDRGFTQGLGKDDSCERIIEAVTSLAHSMKVDLVAEGVETPIQAQRLTGIGCTHAQGFLFGRPQPAPVG